MKTQASPALDSSHVALRLGMCAAALAGTAATVQDANATVVIFNTNIAIPANTAGVYLNLLTGATGTSAFAGWDFNPYLANNGAQLGFYWAPTPAGSASSVSATTTGPALSLAVGAVVSSASTFAAAITGQTTGSPFLQAGTHTMGFRFFNETLGSGGTPGVGGINYGYLTMTNTAGTGFPATITGWRFENSGAAITVVPEAPTALMMSLGALALGAVQLRKLRRQRRQPAH